MQTGAPQLQNNKTKARIIATILGFLVAAVAIAIVVKYGRKSESFQVGIGADRIFTAGVTGSLSQEIKENGPVLYPDLLRHQHGTIVYVQHLGNEAAKGWRAFSARAGSDPKCQVSWQAQRKLFVDKCTGKTFPADGKGLQQFKTTVVRGFVQIELNQQ